MNENDKINEQYEVNPDTDCGTVRCKYACGRCPFGIPEQVERDLTRIQC